MEVRRMKEEGGWFVGRGKGRDGSDGRRVVMGGLTSHNCTGAQRLQGSRGCLGFGTVTAAEGWLWSSVYTKSGHSRVVHTHLGTECWERLTLYPTDRTRPGHEMLNLA